MQPWAKKFLEEHKDKKIICKCGCGNQIKIVPYHYYGGFAKYIKGHNKAQLGRKHSKKSKRKMSKSQKLAWKKNPNRGRTGTKGMFSAWNKGLKGVITFPQRRKTYEEFYGEKRAKQIKRKISKAHLGQKPTRAFKKGMIPWNKGKKGVMPPPWNKGRKNVYTKKSLKLFSRAKKRFFKTEKGKKYLQNWLKNRRKIFAQRPTSPEKKMMRLLKEHNLPYKYVGDFSVLLGKKNPDFININGQKKVLEIFGEYWHGARNKNLKYHQTEEGTKKAYSKFGFKTLVIWENELNNETAVLEKVKEFDSQ